MRYLLLKTLSLLFIVPFFICRINGQEINKKIQSIKNPAFTSTGILFTNSQSSSLYILKNNEVETLHTSAGCGNFVSVSPNKNIAGIKLISDNGMQQPILLNLKSKEVVKLHNEVRQAGQISFSQNGKIAFTIGNDLVVINGEMKEVFELGTYSNLAPISPDGSMVVFNDLNDQLKIITLSTKEVSTITDGNGGYFNPIWSPDGLNILFSSLSGTLKIFNIVSKQIITVGDGFSPSWSANSGMIVYYKTEIGDFDLKNTDLYVYDIASAANHKITNSENEFEVDPIFEGNNEIVFTQIGENKLVRSMFNTASFKLTNTETFEVAIGDVEYFNPAVSKDEVEALDMPYVHQVYDTPDWHNGHASCAPTAAIMTIGYYNILPPWTGWCSSPYPGHYNNYGRYVAERYRYKEYYYDVTADDWGGNTAYGGYGFMWYSSFSPHTRMATYYQRHGITAQQSSSSPYSEAIGEINAGYPYTMCVLLTTSGHLIVAHGVHVDRTLIFNDPYGNKNTPGYPSYDGKNVKYDWPGYNNGFQNLNTVAWCITTRYNHVAAADTVVDDLQFNIGFYLYTGGASSMSRWRDKNYGYKNHMWWTYSNPSKTLDTSYAIWRANLTEEGNYEVFTYIPFSNATYVLYKIYHKDGFDTVSINQSSYSDEWVSLGKYNFAAGNTGYIRLGDATGIAGQEMVFDAVKWSYLGPLVGVEKEEFAPSEYSLSQNYPNPFNPATTIQYSVPTNVNNRTSNVKLLIFDVLGTVVAELVNGTKEPGTYEVSWDASGITSGIYYYRLTAGEFSETKKMILLR